MVLPDEIQFITASTRNRISIQAPTSNQTVPVALGAFLLVVETLILLMPLVLQQNNPNIEWFDNYAFRLVSIVSQN